jgi:hypothetical protein
VAEGSALLKRHTVSSCIEGSNPSLSATYSRRLAQMPLRPRAAHRTSRSRTAAFAIFLLAALATISRGHLNTPALVID